MNEKISGITGGNGFSERVQKIVLITEFAFLIYALIVAWNTPSTGYEPSIYSATPLVLWIAVISAMIVGIIIVIMSDPDALPEKSNLWKYGFSLILFCYAICLSLFILRGYFMYDISGDAASHLGWIYQIIKNGQVPPDLFYPIAHIFLSEISLVSTLDLVFLHKIIPFIFALLSVGFIYIFIRALSSNKIEPLIAAIISCTFSSVGWYLAFTPNLLANLFFPLVLFLLYKYVRSSNIGWKILFVITLILYPVFHPLPAIFIGIILLTLWIPKRVDKFLKEFREKNQVHPDSNGLKIKLARPFMILFIWFFSWYSLFYVWGYSVSQIYNGLMTAEGGKGPAKITSLTNQLSYAQGYGYNVIEIFLKQYGNLLLLFILSVITFFILWKIAFRDQKPGDIFSVSLYAPWAVLIVVIPALFIVNLTFGPLRMLFFQTILEIVFVAFLISFILHQGKESKKPGIAGLTKIGVIVLMVGLLLSGLLTLYPSPYNLTPSYQTTRQEVSGMTFYLEYRNTSVPASGIDINLNRYIDLLLTPEKKHTLQRIGIGVLKGTKTQWHFGYDTFTSIASTYDREMDLIIQQTDKALYVDYYPSMAKYRYTPQDFERLNYDPGASRVYSNGEFDLYKVIPKG